MSLDKHFDVIGNAFKTLQKKRLQKIQKESQSLIQLIDLPDFDISEFFQTLMKSSNQEDVLNAIPKDKLVDFFARNCTAFIETQDELAELKLPVLQEIPKAKEFHFSTKKPIAQEDNLDYSSTAEIIDSFSTSVLEKNNPEILRILSIISEMKQHEKYKIHFESYAISKLFREAYETFIETCEDCQMLVEIGESAVGLRKFLQGRVLEVVSQIRVDVEVDGSIKGVRRVMGKVCEKLEGVLRQVREKFSKEKFKNPAEADTIVPKFLSSFVKELYLVVEPCIYEKEQLSEVLQTLEAILQSASQLQSKGINISRDLRALIAIDLPTHMNKVIEVVVQAFDDLLKDENQLYEFRYFDGLSSMGMELNLLHLIKEGADYGKKCCSQKGILLINAFVVILEPLCDKKWEFLHENVLEQLMDKVSNALYHSNWHYWDYYQVFQFFDRVCLGKIKNKRLFPNEEVPAYLKDKIVALKKISYECWENFQSKITTLFFNKILTKIPSLLLEIKPLLELKSSSTMKPTVFSIDLIFSIDQFLKQLTYRLQKQQYIHLINRLYQYIMYMVQYVLYWQYHQRGSNEKVFTLYKKSQRTFKKVKAFSIEEMEVLKQKKNIVMVGMLSKIGVENLALDLYFLTEAVKVFTEHEKLSCEVEVEKIAQIQGKEQKSEATKVQKSKFLGGIQKFIKILRDDPETIRNYLINKRKQSSKK